MVVRVIGSVVRHGILRERALGDVHPHTAQIQRGVGPACLHPRSTASPAAGHLAASAAAADQFLIQLVVQGAAVPVAVQGIVQPSRVQVVVWVLEREETVF